MDDAEYPAYLKQQSYEDLLSIRYSIDQQTQPARYAMVMAELAQRDKSDGGKESARIDRRYVRYLGILVGAYFTISGVFEVLTGHAGVKYHPDIDVTKQPNSFWMVVGLHFALGAVLIGLGLFGRRKNT